MAQASEGSKSGSPGPDLSPSMSSVVEKLPADKRISGWEIVDSLRGLHPTYGAGLARDLDPDSFVVEGTTRPLSEWLGDIRRVYDPEKVRTIHTRSAIIGLSMLDFQLGAALAANGYLDAMVSELKEPLDTVLTSEGEALWAQFSRAREIEPDGVPTHSDEPARVDLLGRKAFASALTLRLRRIHYEKLNAGKERRAGVSGGNKKIKQKQTRSPGAFLLHIHGPWGSGKTSLLNFLKQSLQTSLSRNRYPEVDPSSWIVVDYNAWQHQRLDPPWWSLMDAVYRGAARDLSTRRARWKLRGKEFYWRLTTGRVYLLGALILFLFSVFAIFVWVPSAGTDGDSLTSTIANTAKALSGILALLGSLWAAVAGLSRSLIPGSAKAARSYMDSSRDPLQTLASHFEDMVSSLDQPVAIFIDDLDRCNEDFTIQLLEGIQTLYRSANVTYVVAADRRWLRTSYEQNYKSFSEHVEEPGRPLGYLFLEKTFQISVSVPRLSPEIQEQYWNRLIEIQISAEDEDLEGTARRAQELIDGLHTEAEILAELERSDLDPVYELALREAAVVRLAAPDILQHTEEHTLKGFAPLLDPNPRAMKRLVNAYSLQRALDILGGGRANITQLALWTIVNLRWPILAEYLEIHPEQVVDIGKDDPAGVEDENLQKLFGQQRVKDVFDGKDVGAKLDRKAIISLANLRTTESSQSAVV